MEAPRRRNLAWLWFSLLRLGLFAVILAVLLLLLPIEPWISTILAAVIAFCVSYIFFTKPRAAVSEQIEGARRGGGHDDDADAEDDVASERERGSETHAVDQRQDAGEAEGEHELLRGARRDRDEPGGNRQ